MQIHPLPQGFGAEIAGFDVQSGDAPEDISALRRAYDEHQLLVFRDCGRIAPERHVEIMRWLGPVGANTDGEGRPWTVGLKDPRSEGGILRRLDLADLLKQAEKAPEAAS